MNQWQEVEGLLFSPPKLSVGAYFELSFLGCGFLILLSNMSDSPRFCAPRHQTRAPWLGPPRLKKAKSNFFFTNRNILHTLKKEPLNIMLLGRVPKHRNQWQEVEGLLFSPQNSQLVHIFELLFLGYGFLIHLPNRSDSPQFQAPWKKIRPKYGRQ